jgi:hypothetical protein
MHLLLTEHFEKRASRHNTKNGRYSFSKGVPVARKTMINGESVERISGIMQETPGLIYWFLV